jgi:hypothetical protein
MPTTRSVSIAEVLLTLSSFCSCWLSLSTPLKFHLRVFLENLRVSLAKHLRDPFVGYTSEAHLHMARTLQNVF